MERKTVVTFAEAFINLKAFRGKEDQTSFNSYMQEVFPELRQYIDRQLDLAITRKAIPEGKFQTDDFLDDLYIKAYDHIHNLEEHINFKVWLYREADALLNDAMVEEEFDEFFMKNYADYKLDELEEMEENFSTDGDGDLVMEEELDDQSYHKNDYELKDIFVDDEEEDHIIKALDDQLDKERFNDHVKVILPKLPSVMASILDMYSLQKLNEHEIASIKNLSVEKVKAYINEAKRLIKTTIKNSFL
ncbi:MAG: sigma-70 family RNA polymerase sigma factor [Bacteroidetes bacterium]|nr:sigma-70 family RNA polymerase sigma factor [Bacteroidota bacterium]